MSARWWMTKYAYCFWWAVAIIVMTCSCPCAGVGRSGDLTRRAGAAHGAPAPTPPATRRRHRRDYCPRADPVWRAHLAPAVFEGRVRSTSGSGERGTSYSVTLQVRRVLKQQNGWPTQGESVRLAVAAGAPIVECGPRVPAPPRPGRGYLVFAERRLHGGASLGPPLPRSPRLMHRVRDVFSANYLRAASVAPLSDVRTRAGSRVRLVCRARARPPPHVHWYRDGELVQRRGVRRIRVQTYRRRSVLVIRHARREDSGRYECRAQGAVGGTFSRAANVTVSPPHDNDYASWGAPCPMPEPSSYCLNGGTCLFFEAVREAACKCPEGFNGQRCENKDVSNRSSAASLASTSWKVESTSRLGSSYEDI